MAAPGGGEPQVPGKAPRGSRALDHFVRPFQRTGRFYARSWRDFVDRRGDEIPVALPTPALAAQAFRDEIVLTGFRLFRPLSDISVFDRINAEVRAAVEFYSDQGYLDKPESFFAVPPPLSEVTVRPVEAGGRRYERLVFDSGYQPHDGEPGRDRWLGYAANRREYALLLRHRQPRPWLVCVHGAVMGRGLLDLTLFRAWHLHEDLGLNVVLPVLPMHGPRARGLPRGAVFPGEDVLDDVHATAQAVWDVRRLLSWIRGQQPDPPLGLNSISLGGYIASLVASLEDGLRCAILGVPVSDLTELLGRHAGISRTDPRRETIALAQPLGRMLSPLSLTPRIPLQGRFIYAGIADQLVHPREQVVRLWEHWGRPEIVWYRGGHTGFFQSRPVQRFVDAALVQAGLVAS
ncbi:alpha/beta hydrolase [Mycolicibacterium chubuense]|uniref:alpha/beta hydrolase family protein n=1 Tax=Mycolicibacterium chubuense TaxID=1800 RepID=UPI000653FED3|nr:alpha/beta hydrolase [Mycolicibacterium chubuense]ORA44585.1 alpha/beta hydrolase [Mycolicibacterium chubuense]